MRTPADDLIYSVNLILLQKFCTSLCCLRAKHHRTGIFSVLLRLRNSLISLSLTYLVLQRKPGKLSIQHPWHSAFTFCTYWSQQKSKEHQLQKLLLRFFI